MEVSITDARRQLPELVRKIREDADLRVRITVHGQVAAELRGCLPQPQPGEAAGKLLKIMSTHEPHEGPKRDISGSFKQHLYGKPEK